MRYYFLIAANTALLTGIPLAQSASPPPTNPVPDYYHVEARPANIAPTPGTQPQNNVQVYGDPRNDTAHPCTISQIEFTSK